MAKYSKEDIIRLASENDVKFINLQFADIFGISKNVSITVENLEVALDGGCMFDGSSVDGFVRIEESDMYLLPDTDTFVILPWNEYDGKVARLICDIVTDDGNAFQGSPRYILKKALKGLEDMGYDCFNVGPECEFFLFITDENGEPKLVTQDRGGYFDLGPVDLGENARRAMCHMLEKLGFEIEASHHENAPGQHEIDFRYKDGLSIADCILTFKQVVKTVAYRSGLYATFIPKPIAGVSGSGMHTNLSILRKGKNIFYSEADPRGMSQEAYWFIGGLIKYAREIAAITNPIVNSYKRLVPGHEAPTYVAWSAKNRSTMIRIPAARGEATRIELRTPDSTCNPYLALALILNAGLEGIKQKIQPPDPYERNIYNIPESRIGEFGIDRLPESLKEAVECMRASSMVKETLGEHVFESYIEAKTREWNDYRKVVTQWEVGQYLGKY
ncbi:L-glutamine synthetase [Anaerobacterium chartisolvens]|uniref:Glutamine synthetase n=1 Tax=Anaerobacterium chartisolvens TaxID=1297424 RepID=A0A369AYT2_9FIRM|nr:type I glutamate--ammonia ligase [Anaerobacterium chartisolvens]RCX13498.1 L-glutamine synthetase [Anaerobacterium chartisolvens]